MARGSVVKADSPEAVDALLLVLRRHGVAKYERDADGSMRVELHMDRQAAESIYPIAPAAPVTPEAPSASVDEQEAVPERQPAGPRPRFSGLASDDALFDGVEAR